MLRLWSEIQDGLAKGAAPLRRADCLGRRRYVGRRLRAAVAHRRDRWGNPIITATRGRRASWAQAFGRVPKREIFAETGLQFMEFNTLFQLLAFQKTNADLLRLGRTPVADARLLSLVSVGQPRDRVHQRDDDAVLSSDAPPVGLRHASQIWFARRPVSRGRLAGNAARPACGRRSPLRRGSSGSKSSLRPRTIRAPRSPPCRPREDGHAQLGLHQLGDLVADGRRSATGRPQRTGAGAQRHQRGGHRRHVSAAQEHHGALARAGVPPRPSSGRERTTTTPS